MSTFWEEETQPDTTGSENVTDEILSDHRGEILKRVLNSQWSEVATTVLGYVDKNLAKRSKCADCKTKLKVCEENLKHDAYLFQLSRGWLFLPS